MNSKHRPPTPPPPENPEETEEIEHYDDAIIGRAFRWSAVALALVALVVIGALMWGLRDQAPKPAAAPEIVAPEAAPSVSPEVPEVRFVDITEEAGITFVHYNGATGDKMLPETMGGGVAFLDFDADGDQDLLFVNSTDWPWAEAERAQPTMALYRNSGDGRFTDVTSGSGLDVSFYGMGVAVGDYDNDGLEDIFFTAVGGNRLFRNLGSGKFEETTNEAGVGGASKDWSTAAAWLDHDNDGDLDLFVANYVQWSREIDFEVGYKLVGIGRAYGQPMDFGGAFPKLYRNEGSGKFTDVSEEAGLNVTNPSTGAPAAKSLGVAPVDLDEDGWIDLVVANDTVPNFLFHNLGNGRFDERGAVAGVAFDSYGKARGAMGIDTAYFRNNRALGIGIANFANEMSALYVAQGGPLKFTDEAITEGIGPASRLLLKFGFFFFDYDLDGALDVLTANGHLEEDIGKIQESQRYRQPAQLFWNAGPDSTRCFVPAPMEKCGPDLFQPIVGRGSAYADIDGDGDQDVVLTQVGGPPILLRNDQELGHSWIRLKLKGTASNRSAIGARVEARRGSELLARQVMPTRSYLSQSELPVTIGLGDQPTLDSIKIVWPSGRTQEIPPDSIQRNELTVIKEPAGSASL